MFPTAPRGVAPTAMHRKGMAPRDASEYSMFSGLGNPSGQLMELRRVIKDTGVEQFICKMTDGLEVEIQRNVQPEDQSAFFEHGFDVRAWAARTVTPPLNYLNSLPVTLVLTFLIQLATFRFCNRRLDDKGEDLVPPQASLGHSQGMAAAIVVGLFTDIPSFDLYAISFAALLLHFGVEVAKIMAKRMEELGPAASLGGALSFFLVILKITVCEVKQLIGTYNARGDKPHAQVNIELSVVNGQRACGVVSTPQNLVAFERYLKEWSSTSGQPLVTRLLPSMAPFHSPTWFSSVSHCLSHVHTEVPSTSLVRPVFSCVDGTELRASDACDLHAYVVRALATELIDWPRTLYSVACHAAALRHSNVWLVDFGPGGGSGATRLTSACLTEDSILNLQVAYFSQFHCIAGPLPNSWLAWAKEDDTQKAAGSKNERKFVFFSDRLLQATQCATQITFSPEVHAAIELEIAKVRVGRKEAQAIQYPDAIQQRLNSCAFVQLRQEQVLDFATAAYPLRQAFQKLLRLDCDLEKLHHKFSADKGTKKERRQKAALMQPLTDSTERAGFEDLYNSFVLEVLAPHVSKVMGCRRVVYQSFPCVRVLRPGEFSIRPHCDAQYQLPDGNVNVYLPLTSIWDTNSLYLESQPGLADYHPLRLDYGQLSTFHGVYCTHFAVENLTDITRCSLDFRLIPGCCYPEHESDQREDFKVGGYYSECHFNEQTGKFEVTRRGYPYWRHGFPHTNK